MAGAEQQRVDEFGRLDLGLRQASDWYLWGPYLSERQWGTVREDYSADGDAWTYLPHDHARSRAYRWGEDGLAGWCDIEQRLCLSLALWNGRDPILKERAFGLNGHEGNHGEDVKEYWWFRDAVPSHSWNTWRYHYPQQAFPYEKLLEENRNRGRLDPEYELLDTDVFDDDRYWVVDVTYAKSGPTDVLMTIDVTNAGPDTEVLHVLPTLWFRNTWSWDDFGEGGAGVGRCVGIHHRPRAPLPRSPRNGLWHRPCGRAPTLVFCDNETNVVRLYGTEATTPWPKDGINDTWCPAPRPSTPNGGARSARRGTSSPWRLARRRNCACACGRRAPNPNRPWRSPTTSPGWSRCGVRRPTSTTRG